MFIKICHQVSENASNRVDDMQNTDIQQGDFIHNIREMLLQTNKKRTENPMGNGHKT